MQKAVVYVVLTPIRATSRRNVRWPRQCSRNIYMHYVLDLWFHRKWRKTVPEGETIIVRYADDFVLGFQYKRNAERFVRDLQERPASFGLELHPEKTRLVEFGRFAAANRKQRGQGRPETFDFLGFTHYCTTTRRGRFRLGRKPMSTQVNRTVQRISAELRRRWHDDIRVVGRWLGRVVNGWLNYYAVPGSSRFIRGFVHRCRYRPSSPARARVHDLGHPHCRARSPGSSFRRRQLHPPTQG